LFVAEKNSIVYKYHIFLIHSLVVGISAVFIAWLLRLVLQRPWVCRCSCSKLSHITSGTSLGVVLLDHMEDLFFNFCTSLHSHQQCMNVSFSFISPTFLIGDVLDAS
jgi:hypothetical protein